MFRLTEVAPSSSEHFIIVLKAALNGSAVLAAMKKEQYALLLSTFTSWLLKSSVWTRLGQQCFLIMKAREVPLTECCIHRSFTVAPKGSCIWTRLLSLLWKAFAYFKNTILKCPHMEWEYLYQWIWWLPPGRSTSCRSRVRGGGKKGEVGGLINIELYLNLANIG